MEKLTIANNFMENLKEYRGESPELNHLNLEALLIRIKMNVAEIDRDKQKIIDGLKVTKIKPKGVDFENYTPEAEATIVWASDFTIELSKEGSQVLLNDFVEFVGANFENFEIIDGSVLYFLECDQHGYKEKIYNPRFKAECFNSEECRLSLLGEDFYYRERFEWSVEKGVNRPEFRQYNLDWN
jgi:hypothetical protein